MFIRLYILLERPEDNVFTVNSRSTKSANLTNNMKVGCSPVSCTSARALVLCLLARHHTKMDLLVHFHHSNRQKYSLN